MNKLLTRSIIPLIKLGFDLEHLSLYVERAIYLKGGEMVWPTMEKTRTVYRTFTIVHILYNRPKKLSPKYARFCNPVGCQ